MKRGREGGTIIDLCDSPEEDGESSATNAKRSRETGVQGGEDAELARKMRREMERASMELARKLQQDEWESERASLELARKMQQDEIAASSLASALSASSRHRVADNSFKDPTKLFLNKLQSVQELGLQVISFEEIFAGSPTHVLFTGGMVETAGHQEYLRQFLPKSCKVTLVVPSRSTQEIPVGPCWPFTSTFVVSPLQLLPPGKENKTGVQHAKLFLCLYPQKLRVVVTTANCWEGEIEEIGQIFWCMDMPRKNAGSPNSHPFASSLSEFLKVMLQRNHSERNFWMNHIAENYDFSVCGDKVDLIASVPGVHESRPLGSDVYQACATGGSEANMFGLRKVRRVLRAKMDSEFFVSRDKQGNQGDEIQVMVSSVASIHWSLALSLVNAFEGHDSVSLKNFKVIFPSNARRSRPLLDGDGVSQPPLSLGLSVLGCHGDNFRPNMPVKREGLLYEYFSCRAQRATRAHRAQHTKMFVRESTRAKNQGKGWIYVGSANLSSSAWGGNLTPNKAWSDERKQAFLTKPHSHRINSYELGILLTNVSIPDYESVIPWRRQQLSRIADLPDGPNAQFKHRNG